MTRTRIESMSQRQYLYILRFSIDNVRQYPDVRGYERLRALIAEHPRAMTGARIAHNLGVERMEWLAKHDIWKVEA
jgi:hypothetical protein